MSNPFVGAIDLTLTPAFDATAYKLAIVQVSYQDSAHDYSFETTVQIPAGSTVSPKIHIPLIDRTVTSYQYRLTFITTGNQQQQAGYITATDSLVVVIPGN